MPASTPFRFVRNAVLVERPSTPFRFVRQAALVPRPSAPFRWERGAPFPSQVLGAGVDGVVEPLVTATLGAGAPGAVDGIPGQVLGPGSEGPALTLPPPSQEKRLNKVLGRPYARTADSPSLLGRVAGIDLTTTSSCVIYSTPASSFAIISAVVIRCTSASGVTSEAFGRVTVSSTDVYVTQQLIGLDAGSKRWIFPSGQGTAPTVPAASALVLEITTAATATSQTVDVDVFGHEL